jgi:hypothetical protein
MDQMISPTNSIGAFGAQCLIQANNCSDSVACHRGNCGHQRIAASGYTCLHSMFILVAG